jgi:hypothetical protein
MLLSFSLQFFSPVMLVETFKIEKCCFVLVAEGVREWGAEDCM